MAIYEDIYKLNYGTPTEVEGADLSFTLGLEEYSIAPNTTLTGTVKDTANELLEGAAVVLYDLSGNPLKSVVTNADGEYSMVYPAGDYKIASGKNWYLSSQQMDIALIADTINTQNFVLADDPNEGEQVVYGTIKNVNSTPLENVVVNLYNTDNELLVTTVSANDGEYVLHDINTAGNYRVTYSKPGYILADIQITIVAGVKKKQNMTLDFDPNANIYSVSGVVKKQGTNIKLADAWVGLYKKTDNDEVMVKETTTNANGEFIFENIPNGDIVFPKADKTVLV